MFFLEGRTRLLTKFIDHKIKSAILKRCTKGYDENEALKEWKEDLLNNDRELKRKIKNLRDNFKISINAENLNILAVKDKKIEPGQETLLFYVFSNKMLINGKNSEMEVEVWRWHDEKDFKDPNKITRIEHDLDVVVRRIERDSIQLHEGH